MPFVVSRSGEPYQITKDGLRFERIGGDSKRRIIFAPPPAHAMVSIDPATADEFLTALDAECEAKNWTYALSFNTYPVPDLTGFVANGSVNIVYTGKTSKRSQQANLQAVAIQWLNDPSNITGLPVDV